MFKNGLFGIIIILIAFNDVICYHLPYEILQDFVESRDQIRKREEEEHLAALQDLPQNGELFEGDIKMDDDIRTAIISPNEKRSGIKDKRWAGGIVPYLIEEMNEEERRLLGIAMAEFRRRTCIRFVRRTVEIDYVVFTGTDDYCASNVGCVGGKQEVNLGKHCGVNGTYLHECMHVLGFIHEHSRNDRDNHVYVNWENIKKSDKSNFNKYSLDGTSTYGQDYNFASVMHYRNDAFTSNGEDTLSALNDPELQFGQRKKFSVGDVAQINLRYGCQKKDYVGLFHNYGENEIQRKKDRLRDIIKRDKYYQY